MDKEEYEKRFVALEEKVNIMTEFINSLKETVEADKKAKAEKPGKGILDDIFG